jgi:hypothetical protein
MKLLLIHGSDDSYHIALRHIKPMGFEVIHYRYVFKAMDNIDEINPAAIIISARDFPRHWKILVQFVRSERPKESCPIIVLKGNYFTGEETKGARFLGVSGLVDDTLDQPAGIDRLRGILSSCVPAAEKRKHRRVNVESWQRIGFLFCGPKDRVIAAGTVKSISSGGLSFVPAGLSIINGLKAGVELAECSLRAGGDILSPVCRLIRVGSKTISMNFISFPGNEREILNRYLDSLPALKAGMKKGA